jgi:glycosyltransferase involved in cell wall biosynthesis
MKVALLTSDRERCGIARYSRDMFAALQPLVDVDLVPIHPWPPEGERLERLRAADIVHLQHEYSFWGTAFPPPAGYYKGLELFRRPGRLVMTAHTVADAETVAAARGPGLKPLLKRLALTLRPGLRAAIEAAPFRLADAVIVHGPAAAVLARHYEMLPDVYHWPMPVPEWKVPASEWGLLCQQHCLGRHRLVTIFGFVTPEKDYALAMRAIRLVGGAHPEALLVVAGGARDEVGEEHLQHLQALAQEMESPVRFTGFLTDADARAVLEHTEVALLPYRSATGSYAAGTALASGCALVTSDLPAFAKPLPALRFQMGDAQDLAEKLNHLLDAKTAREELIQQSRRYAAANNWQRLAEVHVSMYRKLLRSEA